MNNIIMSREKMALALGYEPNMDGENITKTGSKVYNRGNDMWIEIGYSHDMSDEQLKSDA